ncbi:hypothetical protein LCGC14_2309600, partial [marine sediment metagenome]
MTAPQKTPSPLEALEKAQDYLAEQDLVSTFADPDPTRLRETIG